MLCVLDREVKSWNEVNFIAMDLSKINMPENLKGMVDRIVTIANDVGLICPTVKLYKNEIFLKYNDEQKSVILIIDKTSIVRYKFGFNSQPPIEGKIEKLYSQIQSFAKFMD